MNIIIDDWWEILIAGAVCIGALFIIYLTIKQFFSNGGRVKIKNIEAGKEIMQCATIECTKRFDNIEALLRLGEEERNKARAENSESNKVSQTMIKLIMTTFDAVLEALQANKIGNGNIEKARKLLSACSDVQDKYLIDQL